MQIVSLNLGSMLSRLQIITPATLGPKGFNHTMDALDQRGIAHAARVGEVARFEAEGRKVHVVAAHSGGCCLNVNRVKDVQAAIKRERAAGADVVIFSFHGGAEGSKARHVPGKLELAWGEKRGNVKALLALPSTQALMLSSDMARTSCELWNSTRESSSLIHLATFAAIERSQFEASILEPQLSLILLSMRLETLYEENLYHCGWTNRLVRVSTQRSMLSPK